MNIEAATAYLKELIEGNKLTTKRKESRLLILCEEWAFPMPAHFHAAAGIEPDIADETKLVQGTLFRFAQGDLVYDHPDGYKKPWGEALRSVRRVVQIVDAVPVTASRADDGSRDGRRTPRNAGRVVFTVAEFDLTGRREPKQFISTQDGFVEFLLTGVEPNHERLPH